MNNALSGFNKTKQLGKNSFIYENSEGKRLFVKRPPPAKSRAQKIGRLFTPGGLRFRNEQVVYKTIHKSRRATVNAAKVVESIPGEQLVLSYLPHQQAPTQLNDDELIEQIIAFNALQPARNRSLFSHAQARLRYSPLWFTLRKTFFGLRGDRSFSQILALVWQLFVLGVSEPRARTSVLLHNDLHRKNIGLVNNDIYLMDFESSLSEHRWFLIDIVYLTFSVTTFELNVKRLAKYVRTAEAQQLFPTTFQLAPQLKFALCWRLAASLLGSLDQGMAAKQRRIAFLERLVYDQEFFATWLTQQGATIDGNNFKLINHA